MKSQLKNKVVFAAMSGGVDSSVAAALLKKAGFSVIGAHIRCYNVDGCAEQDAEDARRAAETLNIPFYAFDFEQEYKDKVVNYMIDGYRKGITPNPDVMCNKEIKFGLFLNKALEMGADYVATGHYVRLQNNNLTQAKDKNKDQSYFLWTLTQKQLKHCLFPIGNYTKPLVRTLAKKFGLPTAEKKDSQGICFLGQVTLSDFLKQYIPEKVGAVLNTVGEKIGKHSGAHFYTIGQRRIGVGNLKLGNNGRHKTIPHYVADKNIKNNTITISEGKDNPSLYKKELNLINVNFINQRLITNNKLPVLARVRYRQPLSPAELCKSKSGHKLIFDTPQKFIAVGQSAVFYNAKGVMLGGGIIKSVIQ